MSDAGPDRQRVIDAIVAAFSHSQLAAMAGSDALATLLAGKYVEMIEGGKLDLQVLWDELQDQPSFNWDAGTAPVCVIKGWERHLKIEVLLPAHLDVLDDEQIRKRAEECRIPPDLARDLFETPAQRAARLAAVDKPKDPAPSVAAAAPAAGWRAFAHRRDVLIGSLVLGVAALGFIGYTVFGYFAGGGFDSFSAAEIEGGIPIASAEVLGAQVGMQLSDDDWLATPEAQKRPQLEAALRSLQARDIEVVFVKDTKGKVRASAQWAGTAIKTRFLE